MRLIQRALRSANAALSLQYRSPHVVRAFSASPFLDSDDSKNVNSSESFDDFDKWMLGDGSHPSSSSFYRKLSMAEKAHDRSGLFSTENRSGFMDGLDETHSTLLDGMDNKLKKAATYFEFDPREVDKEDYAFRPDVNFNSQATYDTKDLDLRNPGVRRPVKRREFETTTEEVLLKADFRNVEFLANFITDAGIIIKRSTTRISAKAQRKVAREIKTARAFGLMPFTTMGTKRFTPGRTMEDEDEDFSYEASFDRSFVDEGGDS